MSEENNINISKQEAKSILQAYSLALKSVSVEEVLSLANTIVHFNNKFSSILESK